MSTTGTTAIEHRTIVDTLKQALEPLDYVNAMWLAGSQAMGRNDDLSDIDAVLDVADGRPEDAFAAAEAALESLAPIAHRLEIPEPTWHGHSQRIYRLEGCSEHLMIDLVIMQRGSGAPRFDELEIHGRPVIVFDKLGVVRAVPVDRDAHRRAIAKRLPNLRARFHLLRHLADKEIARQNYLDALWRYHGFVLTPLISLLRTRYAPLFHDFVPRYLKLHLPEPVYQRLQSLSFVGDADDLARKIPEAIAWAEDELAWLERDGALDELPLPPMTPDPE